MLRALEQADQAAEHGDVPIGCVIVEADGRELGAGHNRREIDADPTAHAEILALRAAAARRGRWRLDGATVYVTLEPCPMCAGALVNARIERLVYGAHDPKAGAISSLFSIGRDERLNHRFSIESGLLERACIERLQSFFGSLRHKHSGAEPVAFDILRPRG
jgi:tRNA(adenine34) deaminase